MLPAKIRYWLFDTLSVQPMRYVSAVPTREAKGLTKQVYDMIQEDFFKNGSLTSRSKVPQLMAAIWVGGRETMLVEDKVDRTTKDAISAVLSQFNECPYCEDMLISLVHAGGEHGTASDIFAKASFDSSDETLRKRLDWVKSLATDCTDELPETPFNQEQLPEIIGTIMGMSDINRFSHIVMEDSPVVAPFGLKLIKAWALRLFGSELKVTRKNPLIPGRSIELLPAADLPSDMQWAKPNPRIADAVARWAQTVELEAKNVITPQVRKAVMNSLQNWQGEKMQLNGEWINEDTADLGGDDEIIARFAITVAKASYRVTDKMITDVMGEHKDEERFIRILAWSSFTAARRFAQLVSEKIELRRLVNNENNSFQGPVPETNTEKHQELCVQ